MADEVPVLAERGHVFGAGQRRSARKPVLETRDDQSDDCEFIENLFGSQAHLHNNDWPEGVQDPDRTSKQPSFAALNVDLHEVDPNLGHLPVGRTGDYDA